MMDAMREAMKRRKAKGLDITLVVGPHHPEHKGHEDPKDKGDLAPEVKKEFGEEMDEDDPHKMAEERKAMHHDANEKLKSAVHHDEMDNPEHEPLLRGEGHSLMGHEHTGADEDYENMMTHGHEHEEMKRPRTLGARVRAALMNKKKGL